MLNYVDELSPMSEPIFSYNTGSSGRNINILGWEVSFPKLSSITASRSGYELKEQADKKVAVSDIATTAGMIDKIKSVFGLNLTQISKILKVSRATIYNHLDNDSIGSNNAEQYQELYLLAHEVNEKYGCVSTCLKSVLVDGKTLLKHLQTVSIEKNYIFDVLDQIFTEIPKKEKANLSDLDQRKSVISSVVG